MKGSAKYIVLSWALILASSSNGQQEWLWSQHAFNLYDVNSAFAGSYDEISASLRIRRQWVGIEGSPQNQMVSVHSPVSDRLSAGFNALNESIGARKSLRMKLTAAYSLPVKNGRLAFALSGGMQSQLIQMDDLKIRHEGDPSLDQSGVRQSALVFDASLWYRTSKWYLGTEIRNVNEPGLYPGSAYTLEPTIYTCAGYAISLSEGSVLKPVGLLRYTPNTPLSADIGLNLLLNSKFWLGGGYRTNSMLYLLAEWNINQKFRLGYSYDYSFGNISGFGGSFELFLGFNVATRGQSSPSVRYFK
jgi:type IX secretion system PorP/SprF family membrane protein